MTQIRGDVSRYKFIGIALWFSLLFSSGITNPDVSFARSKAAQWLINQQIKNGCGKAGGKLLNNAMIEADLTGDGLLDLVIDHGRLECKDAVIGKRSNLCGARACSIMIYVREGSLLKLSEEKMSIGATINPGPPPSLALTSDGFDEYNIQWNGHKFE